MMPPPILSCSGIRKSFRCPLIPSPLLQDRILRWWMHRGSVSIEALSGVSLSVQHGEWVGLYGPNGSGKTTLLKIIAGLLPPDEGSVECAGRISSFFELGVGFHSERNAAENIYLHGLLQGMSGPDIRRLTDAIIDFAGVRTHADMPIKCYSTGMKMRLGFAAAVHVDAEVYLLDEVLAVGDHAFMDVCYAQLQRMRLEGKSALLVSRDLSELKEFCDRILFLEAGRLRGAPQPCRSRMRLQGNESVAALVRVGERNFLP